MVAGLTGPKSPEICVETAVILMLALAFGVTLDSTTTVLTSAGFSVWVGVGVIVGESVLDGVAVGVGVSVALGV